MIRCTYCKQPEQVVSDDGPVPVCTPCLHALGKVADAYFRDAQRERAGKRTLRQTQTWQWLMDRAPK